MENNTVSEAQFAALTTIIAAGGSVRHGYRSGWLGGVKGLRIEAVEALVTMGVLVSTKSMSKSRKSARYTGGYQITTYTVVAV